MSLLHKGQPLGNLLMSRYYGRYLAVLGGYTHILSTVALQDTMPYYCLLRKNELTSPDYLVGDLRVVGNIQN